jgi:hypothetical protein
MKRDINSIKGGEKFFQKTFEKVLTSTGKCAILYSERERRTPQ